LYLELECEPSEIQEDSARFKRQAHHSKDNWNTLSVKRKVKPSGSEKMMNIGLVRKCTSRLDNKAVQDKIINQITSSIQEKFIVDISRIEQAVIIVKRSLAFLPPAASVESAIDSKTCYLNGMNESSSVRYKFSSLFRAGIVIVRWASCSQEYSEATSYDNPEDNSSY